MFKNDNDNSITKTYFLGFEVDNGNGAQDMNQFKCYQCGKTFTSIDNCKRHFVAMHMEKFKSYVNKL